MRRQQQQLKSLATNLYAHLTAEQGPAAAARSALGSPGPGSQHLQARALQTTCFFGRASNATPLQAVLSQQASSSSKQASQLLQLRYLSDQVSA